MIASTLVVVPFRSRSSPSCLYRRRPYRDMFYSTDWYAFSPGLYLIHRVFSFCRFISSHWWFYLQSKSTWEKAKQFQVDCLDLDDDKKNKGGWVLSNGARVFRQRNVGLDPQKKCLARKAVWVFNAHLSSGKDSMLHCCYKSCDKGIVLPFRCCCIDPKTFSLSPLLQLFYLLFLSILYSSRLSADNPSICCLDRDFFLAHTNKLFIPIIIISGSFDYFSLKILDCHFCFPLKLTDRRTKSRRKRELAC